MRTFQVNKARPFPYIAVIGATIILIALCQGLEAAGISRGYGAMFWVIVVGASAYYGLWPGVFAAVIAALGFDYFFVPPVHIFDIGAPFALLLSSMLVVAIIVARPPQTRALVVLFWTTENSGDYWRDVANGDKRGDAFLKGLHGNRQTHVLGLMVRDMISLQRFAGAEAAFFHRISCDLIKPRSIRVITAQDDAKDLDIEPGVVEVQDHVVGRAVGDEQPRLNVLP
jgi:hypothetical protein